MACEDCGSWFTTHATRPEDALSLYSHGTGDAHWRADTFDRSKTPEVVRTIQALLRPGQCAVDVGCNTGELLDFCRHHGARTIGVELSERGRATCRSKGHRIVDDLRDLHGQADLVFAFDLVEHLYDLSGFLGAAHDALRPGGKLAILTGDNSSVSARVMRSRWWYARYPEHVVFPSWRFWRSLGNFASAARVRTFASRNYRVPVLRRWRTAAAAMVGRGNGLPALDPDHHLVIITR
jgi:SAM-dependent methyltransferase